MQRKLHLYPTTRNDGTFLCLVYTTHRNWTQLEWCSTPLQFNNVSLNDVLLKGPDITNNLQGILLRFRREEIAVIGEVEQMFHNFKVKIDHRNYLRFLWHPENLDLPLMEYRITVHVFGNRPSPAVATYGIRRCVAHSDPDVICDRLCIQQLLC